MGALANLEGGGGWSQIQFIFVDLGLESGAPPPPLTSQTPVNETALKGAEKNKPPGSPRESVEIRT